MRTRFLSIPIVFYMSLVFSVDFGHSREQYTGGGRPLPQYKIGIVTDGPLKMEPDLVSTFKEEILRMAEGEFRVAFPESMVLEADGTRDGVKRDLKSLLDNPGCDLVLALGMVASTEAVQITGPAKPLVAPLVYDAKVQKAPKKGVGSGVANLYYVDVGSSIDREVLTFRKLVPFYTMAFLMDERDVRGVPVLAKLASYLSNEHSIKVHLVPVGSSVADAVNRIPADTEAVLVGPLWQLSPEDIKQLGQNLLERKLPSFAAVSYEYIKGGLFATTMPENAVVQLARQVAINIQEIMLGEKPGTLPVAFSRSLKLAINMATARAMEVYPSLDYMTGSILINEERYDIERKVTLPEVVAEALEANLDLALAEREVAAGVQAVKEARSALLPQISVGTGARLIDDDRAALGQGTTPERAWTGNITASQQIYSENSWAGYDIEKHTQSGREQGRESIKLGIMFEASTAYLEVLRRKTIEQLQKDNMRLTQANLDRSRTRQSIGVAGPDEVYRWEAEFANDRQIVLRAESASFDAMQALNRILNRPLREEFIAQETDLSDPLLIGGDKLFYRFVHNPRFFKKFQGFAIQEGMKNSPEIKAVDTSIAAQQRSIQQTSREYWLPAFSLEADAEQLFTDGGAGQRDEDVTGLDDTGWSVGVFARLPLLEGGRKNAAMARKKELLARLKIERRNIEERISQLILQALNNTRSSYPSINLSRDAVDAARRNLKLVTDSYVEGIKSIIDLLDAQNQALNAELDSANAVYNFLIDLMAVQRSMGSFFIFLPPGEREVWTQRVKEHLQSE